ncbi:hypothetical protein [Salimicrobium flavidum]|uniref:Uncharacterized protein n=1 Tax=Salimicrobium flavidum TaxID=570947 RepID=A0A1N7J291_9BACI|nr:hypothetical protein [Salimicrobium flavidum]SIS43351.1 hypothetical protein SAMN05421687_103211 [Salimicrobium flavidum]
MSNIIRFKILWTDQFIESRRIHMFDMKTQNRISFNYELMARAPQWSVEKELRTFLKAKQKKIDSGYYDGKGHAS